MNDTLLISGASPLLFEDERVYQWNQFFGYHTGVFIDESLLPTGLEFKSDITGRDPSKWSVLGWYYNGIYYESEAAFRRAINSTGFVRPWPNVDGAWGGTDYNNETLPNDKLNPPVSVQPDGSRFAVDVEEKYVEWSRSPFNILAVGRKSHIAAGDHPADQPATSSVPCELHKDRERRR